MVLSSRSRTRPGSERPRVGLTRTQSHTGMSKDKAPMDSVPIKGGEDPVDAVTAFKLEALSALHERKVAALMRSIDTLRDELARLKAQSKEHRRSQLIQSLREKLREQELTVDVLKEALLEGQRGKLTEEQVNELVILRTLGGPKRFRPKSREELQNELAMVSRRCETMTKRICGMEVKAKTIADGESKTANYTDKSVYSLKAEEKELDEDSTPRLLRDETAAEALPSAAQLQEVASLINKLEEAQVSISRYELQLAESEREVERLCGEMHAAKRECHRYEQLVAQMAEIQRQLDECRNGRNIAEVAAARKDGEIEALRLEMSHLKASNAADSEAFKQDISFLHDELVSALAKEDEMREAVVLERERAGRAIKGEVAAKAIADGQIGAAERALQDAIKQRERLQSRLDERETEMRREHLREKALRRDASKNNSELRRNMSEQKRLFQSERSCKLAAEEKACEAARRADSLKKQFDALRHELRTCAEARSGERADAETERLQMMERIRALETALEQERGHHNAGALEAEAQIEQVLMQTERERNWTDKFEEMNSIEKYQPHLAKEGEADYAASATNARMRQNDLKEMHTNLRRHVRQIKADLSASVEGEVVALDEQKAVELVKACAQSWRKVELIASSRQSPSPYVEQASELHATRNALAAHVRLAGVYSRVYKAFICGATLSMIDNTKTEIELRKARNELESALASNTVVKQFYVAALVQTGHTIDILRHQSDLVTQSAQMQASWLDTTANVRYTKSPLFPRKCEPHCPMPALEMQHPPNESHLPSPTGGSTGVEKTCHEIPNGLLDVAGTGRDVDAPTPSATTSVDDRYLGDDDGQEFSQSCHDRSEKSCLSSCSSGNAPPVRVCMNIAPAKYPSLSQSYQIQQLSTSSDGPTSHHSNPSSATKGS